MSARAGMTTNPTLLAELAERVEKAMGPDRELSAAIAECIDAWRTPEQRAISTFDGSWGHLKAEGQYSAFQDYTASLDAAMSLVPEGHKWSVTQQDREKPNEQWWGEVRRGCWTSYDKAFPARGATPALALCAAALRAHMKEGK